MIHRRKEFSSKTKREAYQRSKGICECHRLAARGIAGFSIGGCGVALRSGSVFYEHIHCDALSGLNDLDNAAVLTKTCWRRKTDTHDLPRIAKANRQRDRNRGIVTRSCPPIPGSRLSRFKKKMDGTVVLRRTAATSSGEPGGARK